MAALDPQLFRRWVAQAARAPSAHNTQPARWCSAGTRVELHEDPARWLRSGDPAARDQRIALGMAWEALRLAASADGWSVHEPVFDAMAWPAPDLAPRRIACARCTQDVAPDALAAWQEHRHCWRGKFAPADTAARAALQRVLAEHADIAQMLPADTQATLAGVYDRAAAQLLAHTDTARELYDWMRFSPRDARWPRDGLSADCLALSGFEARAARVLMRPAVLTWVRRAGLAGMLVSERAKTLSATGLVVIHAARDADPFAVGREWYRCWLALTAAGIAAVPMSALVDVPDARAELARRAALPAERVAFNVLRVGIAPHAAPLSARLPLDELLLGATDA